MRRGRCKNKKIIMVKQNSPIRNSRSPTPYFADGFRYDYAQKVMEPKPAARLNQSGVQTTSMFTRLPIGWFRTITLVTGFVPALRPCYIATTTANARYLHRMNEKSKTAAGTATRR